jgi:hypothetical protein
MAVLLGRAGPKCVQPGQANKLVPLRIDIL